MLGSGREAGFLIATPPLTLMDFWRDIVDSLSDAVIVLSASLELRVMNPAAEGLIGAPNPALIGQLMEGNPGLKRMVKTCLAKGEHLSGAEVDLRLGSAEVAVRVAASPLVNARGQVEGAVLLIQDLSHHKDVERVLDVFDEASLGLSPAGLAHEVKNPLTGIKGAAELIAGLFPADQRAQQYCALILDRVDRIAGLVEQVLSVSAPQRLKQGRVNIHRVLHQALALAGLYPAPAPGITVEQLFDPSLPDVYGDEAALERVFVNLVNNALEAIEPPGTIRLATRIDPQIRRFPGGAHQQFLRVEISDSGKGLAATDISRLFTPFFTTKPSGTGLGLMLSRRIVALHGGKLWAEPGGQEAPAANSSAGRIPHPARTAARTAPVGAGDPTARPQERVVLSGMSFKVTLPVVSGSLEIEENN